MADLVKQQPSAWSAPSSPDNQVHLKRNSDIFPFRAVRDPSGRVVGDINIFSTEPGSSNVEIAYVLSTAHHGKGIVSEAVRLAIDVWARQQDAVDTIEGVSCHILP
jgi:RimJ/RimL family protein N-acetyltransferase